jgi:hypothetical protein
VSGSNTEHVTTADGLASLLLDDGDVTITTDSAQDYMGAGGSLKAMEQYKDRKSVV